MSSSHNADNSNPLSGLNVVHACMIRPRLPYTVFTADHIDRVRSEIITENPDVFERTHSDDADTSASEASELDWTIASRLREEFMALAPEELKELRDRADEERNAIWRQHRRNGLLHESALSLQQKLEDEAKGIFSVPEGTKSKPKKKTPKEKEVLTPPFSYGSKQLAPEDYF